MPLVNLKPVLREAKAKGYAVAAFNPVDYASMKAMVKAAEELNAPVIIQTSAKTIKYYGHRALVEWMREIADDSPVPVVLHLDHGKDVEITQVKPVTVPIPPATPVGPAPSQPAGRAPVRRAAG